MSENTPPWYVLTGGPCAGKTTTVEELRTRGYGVLPEAGRMYIEEQLALGRTIDEMRSDLPLFEKSILRKHVELEAHAQRDEMLFLDRGMPDNLAYYRVMGVPEDDELRDAIRNVTYKKVFLLELLEFANDSARYESPEEARNIHETIRKAYEETGYTLVDVPVLPVGERVDFILSNL